MKLSESLEYCAEHGMSEETLHKIHIKAEYLESVIFILSDYIKKIQKDNPDAVDFLEELELTLKNVSM